MKSIIVPIDFSEQSEMALKVAATLSEAKNSEIVVLHMLELSPVIMANTDYMPQEHIVHMIKMSEKRFEDFLDRPYLKDKQVTAVVKHFKVFSEVNEVAEKHDADLIVMGSHGTDGLEEIFVGSNTERVVRSADVPVLVVKGEVDGFKADRVVFACDFKDENLPAIKKAAELAEILEADLYPVYINTPADTFLSTGDAFDRITKFLDKAKLPLAVEIYNDYNVEKGVLNYSESIGADLIGIPTHGRKGLSHFFLGSIGEDIANHSKIPVVTFKI